MRALLTRFATLALCLSLLATAQAVAVARATPGAEGYLVLCTSAGPVMVGVDAEGNPAPPRYCPDGVLALFHAAALAEPPLVVPTAMTRLFTAVEARHLRPLIPTAPSARGPPALV